MSLQPYQQQAYRAFLIWYSASNFCFVLITTINLVYQFSVAHLSPFQLVLVGTVLELTAIIAQIPTGVIADVFSRRLSLIAGTFLVGFGFTVEGIFASFGTILLAQVFWGVGSTLLDGADAAWLADEVGEDHLERIFLRAGQIAQVLTLLAIPLSIVLGSLRLNVPIVVGGVSMMVLSLTMPFFLPERVFMPPSREGRTTWDVMVQTLRQGITLVRVSPTVSTLMGIELFFGLASEGWDRLWQPFLITQLALPVIGALQPIVWIGVAEIVSRLLGIGLTQIAIRRLERTPNRASVALLVVLHMARVGGVVAFALSGNIVMALLAYWVVGAAQLLQQPLYDARFARGAAAEVRATVISTRGLVNAAGQIAGGPAVGAIGNRSLRAAMLTIGVLLAPVFPLLGRLKRREQQAVTADISPVETATP